MKIKHGGGDGMINGRSMMAVSEMYHGSAERGAKLLKELKKDAKNIDALHQHLDQAFDVLVEGIKDRKQLLDKGHLKQVRERVKEALGTQRKTKRQAKEKEAGEKKEKKEKKSAFDFDFGLADL